MNPGPKGKYCKDLAMGDEGIDRGARMAGSQEGGGKQRLRDLQRQGMELCCEGGGMGRVTGRREGKKDEA